ncbi:GATA transcription factor 21-like [Vicia villosa]|uniref:GATA transcription factor 21-like n=1 Tax=Vicia villosa TaxID=3911 RepID=UPI00273AD4DD|nr:GATA transcription factor 21-like [Vicia villosa]
MWLGVGDLLSLEEFLYFFYNCAKINCLSKRAILSVVWLATIWTLRNFYISSNEGIQNERYNQGSPTARVCTECQTTSTPLWRSGTVGPKTLCNACGIRQRKTRRAAVEAADNSLGHGKAKEEKLLVNKCTQFKKNKTSSTSTSTVAVAAAATTTTTNDSSLSEEMMERLDFFLTKVRKKSGFESTTEEVADTTLLLMDISCGYVYP